MSKEIKSFPALVTKVDAVEGIVEAFVAVMGNIDHGNDIIHPGAFSKTISERGLKIRVLDNHNAHSILNVVGKPIEIREVGKAELPPELLNKYPDATGGLFTKTQYLMGTEEGAGVFARIAAGAVDEYSIGFNIVKQDFSKVKQGEREITVRNLRELKLWEYSPVIWAMNDATTTVGVKSLAEARALKEAAQEEEKQRSMSAHVQMVVSQFDEQGFSGDAPIHNNYYVREVFEEYIIVCGLPWAETPYPYYQVGYVYDEETNRVTFDPFELWIGGNYVFTPGEKSGQIAMAAKEFAEELMKLLLEKRATVSAATRGDTQPASSAPLGAADAEPPEPKALTPLERQKLLNLIAVVELE